MRASARAILLFFALTAGAVAGPARAEDLPSGWTIEPIEAPVGEARSCAATKMTGSDRGIGFTQLASGAEFMTVAVEGWSYPLGEDVTEQVKIGDAAPFPLKAFGQNNATLAKGMFTSNPALKSAKTVEIGIGGKHLNFDVDGLDKAFEALATCMLRKA